MKSIFIAIGICAILSTNLYGQQHLIQMDLDNVLKYKIKESDSIHTYFDARTLISPTINYSFITKNNISHSIRFSYYKLKSNNETFNFYPTVYYQINTDATYNNVSIGYALGKIHNTHGFLFHSQIIADFRVKSKYLDHYSQRVIDTTNGTDQTYFKDIYFPRQNFISLYLKQTISHKLYKNLYVGLGLGYGLEYSKFIDDRVIKTNVPNTPPNLLVSNDGYYILQMNLFPSVSLSYKFGKREKSNND